MNFIKQILEFNVDFNYTCCIIILYLFKSKRIKYENVKKHVINLKCSRSD